MYERRDLMELGVAHTGYTSGGFGCLNLVGGPMGLFAWRKSAMVAADRALPGRDEAMPVTAPHLVLGTKLTPPFPDGFERAIFGMGCFWGAERTFWTRPGVYTTAV